MAAGGKTLVGADDPETGSHGTGETSPATADVTEADREATAALILKLRTQGIGSQKVLSALERVPRRLFLSAPFQRHAYEDSALPIECGQTISQPTIVAMMTEALDLSQGHRVLEIGTGSGYQAAILGHLSSEVHTLERYKTLADLARARLATLKIGTVHVHHCDGTEGLPEKAPFDRIIVTAAAPEIPPALIDQLADGGKLVMPLGQAGNVQSLVVVEKKGATTTTRDLAQVRFVPLVDGVATRL